AGGALGPPVALEQRAIVDRLPRPRLEVLVDDRGRRGAGVEPRGAAHAGRHIAQLLGARVSVIALGVAGARRPLVLCRRIAVCAEGAGAPGRQPASDEAPRAHVMGASQSPRQPGSVLVSKRYG